MLPHVGVLEFCETKKAYFIGYIVHKLLMSSLGARRPDDLGACAIEVIWLSGNPISADAKPAALELLAGLPDLKELRMQNR